MTDQPQNPNRKALRWLDVGGQVLCILIPLAYWLSVKDDGLNGALSFILIYLAIGAWQAVSCVAWIIATPWRKIASARKIYLALLGFLVLCLLPILLSSPARAVGPLLVGTGALGVYYLVLSIFEARKAMR